MLAEDSPFYIDINRKPTGDSWYVSQPMGKTTLRNIIKLMCEEAGIEALKADLKACSTQGRVCQTSSISVRYKVKLEFDNKKTDSELSGMYKAYSLTECAAMCQGSCVIFGYNPVMKKCRAHKEIFTSDTSEETGWRYYSIFLPVDCKELRENGYTNTGVYEIYPFQTGFSPVKVYCDMKTMDGGWTAIQKRVDGSVDFDRTWAECKIGFGKPEQEVWIGNDLIHQLTKGQNSYLYVSITLDLNTGNTGRDLSGMYFTTSDRDNDRYEGANCAVHTGGGGWWFNSCHFAFLNHRWSMSGGTYLWHPTVRYANYASAVMMLIKRH
ncbi:techylectin-5B-like [Saccostrea echinata]|uniref:techylectin-5B-like n=1 Tax=Saccostrea echinata TaxID=191078 RepID=UPI002A83E324|nr:techylectin-5B-like [Saccostrea echinata]